jgi:FKBP-type peptidyl-prolyl cis-trans isomerase
MLRTVVACVVLVACSKTEPTPPPAASTAQKPAPAPAEAPARAHPQPKSAAPALVTHSDANPPGVPRLTGEIQIDRGLPYIDEVVGTGKSPEKGKSIKVHYTGWLTDGSKFDSSHDRDDPITIKFDSGMVIKGWDIGLASMRVGGKRRLVIPADMGYGENGMGEAIPPESSLVFDVELVEAE